MRIKFFVLLLLCTLQLSAQSLATDAILLKDLESALQYTDIEEVISHTLTVYEQAKQHDLETSLKKSLWQLSDLHFQQNNTIKALAYGLELSTISEGDPLVNEHIANIYQSEGIHAAAINYYQKALQNRPTDDALVSVIQHLAHSFLENNLLDSAVEYYHQLLSIHKENMYFNGHISTLQQLAKIADQQHECSKALAYYQDIKQMLELEGEKQDIPIANNNIAYQYHCLEDYANAITYFKLAYSNCTHNCNLNKITLYTNLGIAHYNNNEYSEAIKILNLGLTTARRKRDSLQICSLENLIAKIYLEQGELYEASSQNSYALQHSKSSASFEVLKNAYLTQANIHEQLYEYDKALVFYQEHLRLRDSLLLAERLRQEKLLQHQFSLEQSEKEIKLLLVNKKIQDLAFDQLTLEKNNLALATAQKENELTILRREQEINDERLRVEELQALKATQELSLTRQRLLAAQKDGQILGLEQKEAQQALELSRRKAEEQAQQQQILILNNEKDLQQLEIEKQAAFNQLTNWILAALSIILFLIFGGYLFARRTNKQLKIQKTAIEVQKEEIESEKLKSEQLLLNILPKETAKELITNGFAKPKHYDNVSVLFADFENFTTLAEQMSPSELIEELNACFIAFDDICSRHNLEKIKTIGDAYMCAGGIPIANQSHGQNTVDAALEMMSFIDKRRQNKLNNNQNYWKMRIGIHSGPVVAGVVGSKKFAYDIWGDTVNIAARMESNSEAGKINISKSTKNILPNQYFCKSRGILSMKNKADAEMFFLEGVRNQ